MGRIVVTEYMSVDGVVEAPSGTEDFPRVGWIDDFTRGPEGDEFKVEETMASDALLVGRLTYEGFAPVWPHVEGEFADKFNAMPKYVISSRVEDPEWNKTSVTKRLRLTDAKTVGDGIHILVYERAGASA